jgi:alkylated DNA nucleotide flippase Atl1
LEFEQRREGVRNRLSLRVVAAEGDQSTQEFAWPKAEELLMTEGVAARASCIGSGQMLFDQKTANLP